MSGYKIVKIEITKVNNRRKMRSAPHVEYKLTYDDGDFDYLWMSKSDLKANIKEFSDEPEFVKEFKKGLAEYT